jgi:hypothetical protein
MERRRVLASDWSAALSSFLVCFFQGIQLLLDFLDLFALSRTALRVRR